MLIPFLLHPRLFIGASWVYVPNNDFPRLDLYEVNIAQPTVDARGIASGGTSWNSLAYCNVNHGPRG